MLSVMVAVFALILVSQFFLAKNKPNTPPATQTAQTAKVPETAPPAGAVVAPETAAASGSAPAKAAPAETETVVEAVLGSLDKRGPRSRPWRIADLVTGSGAIALALLTELPNAFAIGTDIDTAAVTVARDNTRRLGVTRAAYLVCNMASALHGRFDVIVSNPPYIASAELDRLPPEVRQFDPQLALDGGDDGLHWYRALATAAPPLLADNGILVVELGKDQGEAVAALMAAAGLAPTTPQPDLNGVPRALIAENVARDL